MSSHPSQTSRMLLVLAWATVVGITPISASEKDQVPSASTSERFEGYLFMDVDGHPLPFQSDEEIEERLRNAAVVSQSKIPAGVSRPKRFCWRSMLTASTPSTSSLTRKRKISEIPPPPVRASSTSNGGIPTSTTSPPITWIDC